MSTPVSIRSVTTPNRNNQMGKIIDEGLVPDTDPIYKRGWTILTGRNLNSDYASRSKKSSELEKPSQKPERKPVK